jgi:D-3-phosphoglycerate dehydrogenase
VTRLCVLNAEPEGFSPVAVSAIKKVAQYSAASLTRADLISALPDCDALIVRFGFQIDEEIFSASKRLKVVATATTGLDHIDLEAARRHGVEVVSLRGAPELNEISATAEYTWGLILSLTRRIPWALNHPVVERNNFKGHDLKGKTLGILGFGRVGKKVLLHGKNFGMETIYQDPYCCDSDSDNVPLRILLSQLDILTIHVPLNEETTGMIGIHELAQMKPSAFLINTSRGAVVDEIALLYALETGALAGAALDVVSDERAGYRPIRDALTDYAASHDNLIVTPHIAGATHESMAATEIIMANKLIQALAG